MSFLFTYGSHTSIIALHILFSFFTLVTIISIVSGMTTIQRKHWSPHYSISNPPPTYSSVQEFYNAFNLMDTNHAYFSFMELQEIFHLDGMDQWAKVLNPSDQVEFHLYLRSFLPSAKNEIYEDFDRIEKMYFSLFELTEDHNAIQSAMANAPMMGLFLMKRTHNYSLAPSK